MSSVGHGDAPAPSGASAATRDVEVDEARRLGLPLMSLLALLVGIVTGFGAVGFRALIGVVHNLLFFGRLQYLYDASRFTPASPWGALVIGVPVLGALIVTFLVTRYAPEAKGHGVPEVMDAIYYGRGIIRPIVAIVKSIASAIAIGSGAAVGREGPIIQIGSGFGSTLGQFVPMNAGERIILVAAGAGGGIAATFNTPIGGVMFAIELMMPEVSARTFLPVALATGTATFIGRYFFGEQPAFTVPSLPPLGVSADTALMLVLYASLGVIVGVAAAGFVRGLSFMEDLYDRIPGPYWRHMTGMALVGVLMYVLYLLFGHYYIEGVGYSTVQAVLFGHLSVIWLLGLLFLCKGFATTTSLGSGSSGGIFSPSLYMGATVGGGYAALLGALHLPLAINVPSFAMVGMGAMVGGATGAAMTAVTMIFEMTRDYSIVLPMILAVAISVGVRRLLSRENIYTLKLYRRGHVIPKALQANMFLVRPARDVMDRDVLVAPADQSLESLLGQTQQRPGVHHVVVAEGERIVGVLRLNDALREVAQSANTVVRLGQIASPRYVVVSEKEIVFDIIRELWPQQAQVALVRRARTPGAVRAADILGVISKEHVADSVASSVAVYPGEQ